MEISWPIEAVVNVMDSSCFILMIYISGFTQKKNKMPSIKKVETSRNAEYKL